MRYARKRFEHLDVLRLERPSYSQQLGRAATGLDRNRTCNQHLAFAGERQSGEIGYRSRHHTLCDQGSRWFVLAGPVWSEPPAVDLAGGRNDFSVMYRSAVYVIGIRSATRTAQRATSRHIRKHTVLR